MRARSLRRRRRRTYLAGASRSAGLILCALGLGYFVPHIRDRWLPYLGTDTGRDQLIAFLTSLATGMMTFTGVVLSLVFLMLELGTSGYTPRIVSSWVKDPRIANATGVFTGTFVYSLMALRGVEVVQVQGSRSCVLTIYVAFTWLLASLWMLTRLCILFAEHDQSQVLRMLGRQGAEAIDQVYEGTLSQGYVTPPAGPEAGLDTPQVVLHDGPPLYVVQIQVDRLVKLAHECGALIRLPLAQGDSVTAGSALALVYGRPVLPRRLLASLELGVERDVQADPKYALRLLVDVALRGLSSANDPTTTVQALDQIEALLVKLSSFDLDIGNVRDDEGELRLVYDATTWEEYLELALAEIQYYGAASLQTERRLAALLAFLRDHVPGPRRPAVELLAEQHDLVLAQALQGPSLMMATRSDRQGLGHTLR
jgi:uncharacterized membrane protein